MDFTVSINFANINLDTTFTCGCFREYVLQPSEYVA